MVYRVNLRAFRGAITIDSDTPKQITEHTTNLLQKMFERNSISDEQVVSIFFTVTSDIKSFPPAAAARSYGLTDVPLICAQEMELSGALSLCVRILLHCESNLSKSEIRHVFLRGAAKLRPDLAEPGDELG